MGSVEPPVIRLLREGLESALSPRIAAATLFEALSTWGQPVPSSSRELLSLVRGPLRQSLLRRTDSADAEAIVLDVERLLADTEAPTGTQRAPSTVPPPPPGFEADRRSWPHDAPTTASVEKLPVPVPVLVVAASFAFAYRLEAALGPIVVTAQAVDDVRALRFALRDSKPRMVVVDAQDALGIEPVEVASEIAVPGVLCVIWARELAYGKRVCDALEALGVSVVSLSRREGIEPLLDLVRSRRA